MYGYLPRHSPIIGPISRYLSNSPIYTPPRLARSLRSAAIRPLHGPCPSVSPRRPLRSPSRSARRLGRQSIYLPMSATAYPRTRTHTRHAICPLTSPSHPLRNPSSLGRRPSSVYVPSLNSPVLPPRSAIGLALLSFSPLSSFPPKLAPVAAWVPGHLIEPSRQISCARPILSPQRVNMYHLPSTLRASAFGTSRAISAAFTDRCHVSCKFTALHSLTAFRDH